MLHPRTRAIVEQAVRREGPVVVLTGAGISAESGIPTFRGKEGYWTIGSRNYQPQELATFSAFSQMPREIWAWYLYRRGICNAAEPNAAHRALTQLEDALGDRFLLITQNVDGLHRRAGTSAGRIFEIHGNVNMMRCAADCGLAPVPVPQAIGAKEKGAPVTSEELALLICDGCGAPARPHILWMDESYDEEHFRFESSLSAATRCCLLTVIGTAGWTNLPNQIGQRAANSGADLIDINPEENPFSRLAEASGGSWIQGPAGVKVTELVEVITAVL